MGERFGWGGGGWEETLLKTTTMPHNKDLQLKISLFLRSKNIYMRFFSKGGVDDSKPVDGFLQVAWTTFLLTMTWIVVL